VHSLAVIHWPRSFYFFFCMAKAKRMKGSQWEPGFFISSFKLFLAIDSGEFEG
jgi:hypothetical protein